MGRRCLEDAISAGLGFLGRAALDALDRRLCTAGFDKVSTSLGTSIWTGRLWVWTLDVGTASWSRSDAGLLVNSERLTGFDFGVGDASSTGLPAGPSTTSSQSSFSNSPIMFWELFCFRACKVRDGSEISSSKDKDFVVLLASEP